MKKILAMTMFAVLSMLPMCACAQRQDAVKTDPPYIEEQQEQLPPASTLPQEEPKAEQQEEPQEEPNEPNEEPQEVPLSPAEEAERPPLHQPEMSSAVESVPKTQYICVLTDNLNIRAGAGTEYASLGKAEKGVLLALEGRTGGWYETVYRGKRAYVSASEKYTCISELTASDDAVESVILEGMKYLGTPYVYGAVRYHDGRGNRLKGFTDTKFDCSSLMQYIFYRGAGTLLDVTTRTQILQGTPVGKGEIRRGDLLFFTNDSRRHNAGIERVGHVALYLGENYILHTASDFAKVEQISLKRWNYFLQARRVI